MSLLREYGFRLPILCSRKYTPASSIVAFAALADAAGLELTSVGITTREVRQ